MNAPVAASRRADALAFAWTAVVAVTALGHVTALRNVLTVVVALATLWHERAGLRGFVDPARRRRDWREVAPLVALCAWAVASVAWSPAPDVTLGKLRTDLAIPALAGVAAFALAARRGRIDAIVDGFVVGLVLLAALSAFAYLPPGSAPAGWPMDLNGGIVRPLPHWYPGPGDASMYAILAIAPLTFGWRTRERHPSPRRRGAWIAAGAVLLGFVLVTTNNRNAVLVAPLVVAFQWALDRRLSDALDARTRRSWRRVATAVAVACVAASAVAAVLEWGARERLAYLHRPRTADSAALELVATDTRPRIWRYYVAHGLAHPWIGMGFGRTVPGIGWQTERDPDVAAIEANAYIHAHNVAINWWLQLGFVGLALAAASLLSLVRAARRRVDACGRIAAARRLDHALLAVLVAVLARNLTDDFLVYGMATATSVVVGALLGALSSLAAATAPTVDAMREAITSRRTP